MDKVTFGETVIMPLPYGPPKDPIERFSGLSSNVVRKTKKYAYLQHGEPGMFMVSKLDSFDLEFFPLNMLDFQLLVGVDRIHVHVHVRENGDTVYKVKPVSASEDEGLEFSTVLKKRLPYKEGDKTDFRPVDLEAYKKISAFNGADIIFSKFLKEVMIIITDQLENSIMA
jgi:hypothetical protein